MIKLFSRLFRRRQIVVTTFTVKKTDRKALIDQKCQQLAREQGREWRLR